MYDQNPLLHKLSIDDLARDYQAELERQKKPGSFHRISGVATTISVVVATIFVIGTNVV